MPAVAEALLVSVESDVIFPFSGEFWFPAASITDDDDDDDDECGDVDAVALVCERVACFSGVVCGAKLNVTLPVCFLVFENI